MSVQEVCPKNESTDSPVLEQLLELDDTILSRTLDSRDFLSTASKTKNSPPCPEEVSLNHVGEIPSGRLKRT